MGLVILLVPYAHPNLAGDSGTPDAAVAAGVLVEILLMIILGVVERGRVEDLGRDAPEARRRQSILIRRSRGFGRPLLLRRVAVDRRPVLRADIVALAHPLCGIVILPEQLQHRVIAGLLRIEDHEDDLGVPGHTR